MSLPPFHVSSWQLAELNAARWMQAWGLSGVRVTAGGADSGIDVTSNEAEAQVKFQASAVGRPALQNLAGAARPGKRLVFFSGSSFSKAAMDFAAQRNIALFVYDLSGQMQALNGSALDLAQNVATDSGAVLPPPKATRKRSAKPTRKEREARFTLGCFGFLALAIGLPTITSSAADANLAVGIVATLVGIVFLLGLVGMVVRR